MNMVISTAHLNENETKVSLSPGDGLIDTQLYHHAIDEYLGKSLEAREVYLSFDHPSFLPLSTEL
jgi:hypothetical protein